MFQVAHIFKCMEYYTCEKLGSKELYECLLPQSIKVAKPGLEPRSA